MYMKKVYPFMTDDGEQACLQSDNNEYNSSEVMWGWITEDNIIFYIACNPRFCPSTGEQLLLEKETK